MILRTQTHGRWFRPQTAVGRFWPWLALLLGMVGLAAGCSPFTMLAFFLAPDPVNEPTVPLARKDKETKIAIIVAFENNLVRNEVVGMDENIARILNRELDKHFKDHKPKVTMMPINQIQAFQKRNRHWREMSGQKLAESLKVDVVVNLEIHTMTLFKRGSANQLYEGQTEISISVTDLEKPDDGYSEDYACQYPKGGCSDSPGDMGLPQFRSKFVDRIARELTQKFATTETRDSYTSD